MTVLDHIHEFWKQFESEQGEILKALSERNYDRLHELLESLVSECSAVSGAKLFIEDSLDYPEITLDAGPNKTSQLICRQMKQLAPKAVTDIWTINDSLQPLSQKAVEAVLQIRDESYSLFDMTVFYQISDENQGFSTSIYCPGFSMIDNPEYKREMCIYLMELAVGQKTLEACISSVDFLDAPVNGMDFCNLTEFYEVIEQTIAQRHWKSYEHPLDIYTVFKPYQDFAHDSLRKDMKLIFTTHPTLVEETLGEGKDVLLDFKDKDGEFGYIYFSNQFEGKDDALFRQELSRQIDQACKPLHCAEVIGGAIGKSYAYIDLAIYDKPVFEKVFSQIQQKLADKVEIHYRSFEQES